MSMSGIRSGSMRLAATGCLLVVVVVDATPPALRRESPIGAAIQTRSGSIGRQLRARRPAPEPTFAVAQAKGGLDQEIGAVGDRLGGGEVDREAQRWIERHGHDPGARRLRPVADARRDRLTVRDRKHAAVPWGAEHLVRPPELVAGGSDDGTQPRVEGPSDRLAGPKNRGPDQPPPRAR